MHAVGALAWVAAVAVPIPCTAQEANAPVAWRARDVAGREIDLECDVREVSGCAGGGGNICEWRELIRDVVVATSADGARGLRVTTRVSQDAVDPRIAVEFFDVERDGSLRPVRSFGSGARRFTARLTTGSSELGWSRSLAWPPSGADVTRHPKVEVAKEAGPPRLFSILPQRFEWKWESKAAADGGVDLTLTPAAAFPIAAGPPLTRSKVTGLDWSAHLDAAGVLIGEVREILDEFDRGEATEHDRFAWRETRVAQMEVQRLARLRKEGDALREAYRLMNARPEEALARLDDVDRIAAPRAFDDVAAALRDYASHRKEWIEISITRAIVDAIEQGEGAEAVKRVAAADSLDALLTGRSLDKGKARELFELGCMIRWADPNRDACAEDAAAVARAMKRRLVLDESDVALAQGLVAAGIDDEDGDRQLEIAGSPPPDADAIRKKIDAWVAGDGK